MEFDAPESIGNEALTVTQESFISCKMNHDKEVVRAAASGQWDNLLSALTGYSQEYFDGKPHPCPTCGKSKFNLFDNEKGRCGCYACDDRKTGDGFGSVMWLCGVGFEEAVNMVGDRLGISKSTPKPKTKPLPKQEPRRPKSQIDDETANIRHKVYSTLAELYGLSEPHRLALKERGLSESDIVRNGYFSVSGPKIETMKTLKLDAELRGVADRRQVANLVPGIYKKAAKIQVFSPSLMIPVRDTQGRIIAIRIRPDKPKSDSKYTWLTSNSATAPGVSPGTPAHVPHHAGSPETLRITEGELKADIATKQTGILTIAAPGVSCWKNALPAVEQYRPAKILLAFDNDATDKKEVARSLSELHDHLATLEWSPLVLVETWPAEHKGIDDAIAAGADIKELDYKASAGHIESLKKKHGIDKPTLQDLLDDLREFEDPHDANRLARINLSTYGQNHNGRLAYWRSDFYRYKSGGWRKLTEDELKAKLRSSINSELVRIAIAEQEIQDDEEKPKKTKKKSISNPMVANVFEELKHLTLLSSSRVKMPCLLNDPEGGRYLLSLENGLLDLDRVIAGAPPEDCFTDHNPDWFAITKLGYSFDKTASSPKLTHYLETSLPDECSRMLVQEFAGYLLVPENPFQRFLACDGDGGTGKSVLLSGIYTALVGVQNTSNIKLDGFGGNQFALINSVGKALNVDPDANESAKINEGLFKQFCIGERLQFEGKNGQPFSMSPTAKCVFGWNHRPRIRDASDGLWRRMLLVGFDQKVSEEEKIVGMETPEWWVRSGELAGVFNWALAGLKRLFEQGGFTISKAMRTKVEDYRKSQNPTAAFIDELVTYSASASPTVKTSSLVAAYRHWAKDNTSEADGESMSAKRMNAAIAQRFGIKSEAFRDGITTARGFKGVQLNDYHGMPKEEKLNF
ncbi:phage/plasmid primase, P4 family [Rhodopirellula bahusiensis]|uniref:SF3 helicase domain-containing protein n=1 Tax=Rhodopirellula bahusiensis TaxID=2014065 RepID=A0A2G1W669_9BACT|nr:phage/plasmid primase, P4 family [Rhodopirellula bahusiensis]PHQ34320.1 hypothetical protein CEE69_14955 [Rhodopirellula bahusiensis]